MHFLQLHILCNRDTRTEEDLALEQQFASMAIPVKTSVDDKIIQEWRPGLVQVSHIACVYPHAKPAHTLIHLYTGAVLTVAEDYHIVLRGLNQVMQLANTSGPDKAKPGYSYDVTLSPLPATPEPPNA